MQADYVLLAAFLALSFPAFSPAEESDSRAEAEAAIAAFGGALKSELTAAMQDGGPLNAIEVCNTRAPAIAESISSDRGLQVSRVSLRNRNPENSPNAWQSEVLESFEKRMATGEAVAALAWQDTVSLGDSREFRFMKAIPTAPLCLGCHGEAIAPPVAEKIAELYPDDKATGFVEGDIRGAFVVTKILEP
jgi:hypothetical protein